MLVTLDARAPAKPAPGTDCNGCGVCCAAEPCPLGLILFRRRRGPCPALEWEEPSRRYRCGLLTRPGWWRLLAPLAARWIAAGQGCDSDARVEDPP